MQKTIIDDALDFARAVFKDDRSGHDYYHTLRVYKMAVRIARQKSSWHSMNFTAFLVRCLTRRRRTSERTA